MVIVTRLHRRVFIFISILLLIPFIKAQSPTRFELAETTIAATHQAIRTGKISCHELVQSYLARVSAYDQPTGLNSLILVNPNALKEADREDSEFKHSGTLRPLECIPMIVKDNYDTRDLQTTGGSLALKSFVPAEDAFMVKKIRAAGAIILAKSNMAEWAFSPYVTVSSMGGITRNPTIWNGYPPVPVAARERLWLQTSAKLGLAPIPATQFVARLHTMTWLVFGRQLV
jgi:amidase